MESKRILECKEMVEQIMEAIEEERELPHVFYPVPEETRKQIGEASMPRLAKLREVLQEIGSSHFAEPFGVDCVQQSDEYEGKNWYEQNGICVEMAVKATAFWAEEEGKRSCSEWPVNFECLLIEGEWYLNPYWVWEYIKD